MATDLEKVKLYGGQVNMTLFTDDQLGIFIADTSSPREAAANALLSLAADKALVSKLIEVLNSKEDSRNGVVKGLIAVSDKLMAAENSIPASATAEMGHGPIGRGQILDNQWARQGIGNSR